MPAEPEPEPEPVRAARPRHLTKTELAVEVLRERIRSGELAAGQRLRPEELTAGLGMSATPIREALRLLQADRLVDYRPHQGIVVSAVSGEEAAEVYRLRLVLEPLAVELAVPRLDLDALERLHERLEAALAAGRGPAIAERNAAWHWSIYDSSGSPTLTDFVRRLWERFPWRSMWQLRGHGELGHEHGAIMEAIRRRDAPLASERMRDHIAEGGEALLRRLGRAA